ncbi:MAG: thioesterase family protein [Acidimicrobiales bacterium]
MTAPEPADDDLTRSGEADRAFLGMEVDHAGHSAFTLTGGLARHDGRLYGGTAVAAAVAMAELVSGRRSLWTTVQFVSGASVIGDRIECRAEVLASGRRTSQVRMSAYLSEQLLFTAVGATAVLKDQALRGEFEEMPTVPAPDDCAEFRFPIPDHMEDIANRHDRPLELRIAHPGSAAGPPMFWARVRGHSATPAIIGFVADMVPMAVVHAAGRLGGGTSLDNTLRVGFPAATDWVLLHLDPHLALGGYGHGTAQVWSPDGTLMATASQTAALLVLD